MAAYAAAAAAAAAATAATTAAAVAPAEPAVGAAMEGSSLPPSLPRRVLTTGVNMVTKTAAAAAVAAAAAATAAAGTAAFAVKEGGKSVCSFFFSKVWAVLEGVVGWEWGEGGREDEVEEEKEEGNESLWDEGWMNGEWAV